MEIVCEGYKKSMRKDSDNAKLLEPGELPSKRKILVVEDNELNRDILSSFLEEKFDVFLAENGEEGLELLSEHYRELSVVLLDICMPVCDGFEFLRRRNTDKFLSTIPVIVMTGSNSKDVELQCLDLGAVDFIPKPYNFKLVMGRINSVIKLRESVMALTAVEHDELTGVYTRQAFFYHAKSFLKTRPGNRFHLVIADIRDFKLINSSYGEKVGDEILCYLAGAYTKMLKTGLVSRYGSDQFVCMTCDDCDLSLETVTKIEEEIAEHAPVPNLMVKYGVYQDIDKSLPVSVICDRGFMAIRSIRDNYECNIAYYTEKMKQKQMQDRLLENRFESAIKNKEFVAYFQPKYDVKTERITGAEFQRELMKKGQELIPISVNLSRTSIHHSDIVERYMKIVEENGIPFSCVPVELTETATLNNVMIRDFTEKLVNAGFALHMDDFGSGYSSLITLSELPFNTLKIDKSLIDCIHQQKGRRVVQQVIILAHGLGMKVVAEGVETADQVELLKEMECDNIQGFYYSRPLPKAEFVKKSEEN